LVEYVNQTVKRTKLHIVRDILEIAHYPCTKTSLYRHSEADWYCFSDLFKKILAKGWVTIIQDRGGNGDLFSITAEGKKYHDKLCNFLESVEV